MELLERGSITILGGCRFFQSDGRTLRVSGYFDFAEIQAMRHVPMYMSDYIHQLDSILSSSGQKLLDNAGSVSQQAVDKATEEYRKWQENTLSPVEEAYLETIKALAAETKGKK